MTYAQTLLDRIGGNPEVARLLADIADFDIERREPVEDLALPGGDALEPVAGDAGGGTYFLVGDSVGEHRPVLYADSEGGAALVADSLTHAVETVLGLPSWRDCLNLAARSDGSEEELAAAVEEVEEEVGEDIPDLAEQRAYAAAALGLRLPPAVDLLERLYDTASRTGPDHLPINPWGDPYELLF
ncbi:hypothetical protein [Wenjunlia tyrosinilytica]|uniref:Uncharacterized protein n=1 Tax=Wenjunlia tyrosinilytica TaxID=1544741 RepID=A0A917ZVE9_9ACTN|nr:hypothetical protein [Wenjunlia tyrosinilytica]GGO94288.1 hypothetical protein GCM10012280_48790 [Wenjunlia tyrosinilytica]